MECPFQLCSAWVTPVIEQAQPDDDELTIQRIPIHEIQGVPLSIACPASLIAVPLNADARQLLDEQVAGIERMVADRFPEPKAPEVPATPPGPSPPSGRNWFKPGHLGDNPTGEFIGGYPVISPLPGQGVPRALPVPSQEPSQPPTQEGPSVTDSHAEAGNALLAFAKEKIGEIQTSISSLTHQLEGVVASVRTFQERGEEIIGAVAQAAENSQVHDYRISEAMSSVHYATNDQAAGIIMSVHEQLHQLQELYNRLGAAHDQLEEVVF